MEVAVRNRPTGAARMKGLKFPCVFFFRPLFAVRVRTRIRQVVRRTDFQLGEHGSVGSSFETWG